MVLYLQQAFQEIIRLWQCPNFQYPTAPPPWSTIHLSQDSTGKLLKVISSFNGESKSGQLEHGNGVSFYEIWRDWLRIGTPNPPSHAILALITCVSYLVILCTSFCNVFFINIFKI